MKRNRRHSNLLLNILRLLLALALLHVPGAGHAQEKAGLCPRQDMSYAKFSVDGVELEVCTTFLMNLEFVASDPQSIVQTATAIDETDIHRTISISAIPYGLRSPTEDLPTAFSGGAEAYQELTRSYRQSQNGDPRVSKPIQIFGYITTGIESIIKASASISPVLLQEWFVEAGERIWIVRTTHTVEVDPTRSLYEVDFASEIEINSRHLSDPSTSLIASKSSESLNPNPQIGRFADSDLPFPSWWDGVCDAINNPGSYPLGSSYRGVKACGPFSSSTYDSEEHQVVIPGGNTTLWEWECVELVMRFMYLAYGVKTFSAHGKDVVNNFPISQYSSLNVEKVVNGTPHKAPRPGDIISYGSNTLFGHTSIVSESNVDGNGNGTLTVIEQNAGSKGTSTHQVSNWVVTAPTKVDNWLLFNSDGSSPIFCPSDRNGIILYKDWNYLCGDKREGEGYVRRNDTGWQNVPGSFNDKATSVRIPSGWSVKLYEHGDRGGGWACRSSDDDSFGGNYFNNSTSLNDRISSFEVFRDSRCGEPVPPCPATSLIEPPYGRIFDNRTIIFRWDDVSCNHNGFFFRVKTVPNMDSGGEIVNEGDDGTSRTVTFDSRWDNRDLYWSVRAANAPGGASWAAARHFRISLNKPPTVSFDTANGNGDSRITTREQNWTFRGTAGDPENKFSRVELRCNDCDNRGSGDDRSTSTSWSITRNGISGRNFVYFEAYDDKQGTRSAKTLELNIDLAAPTTEIQINGISPNAWPQWFTEATQVRLTGRDNGTGRAVADVREVRYQRDGGGVQVQNGATVNFSEGGDGSHTVRYYSVDNVGNTESERSATYRVDRTSPTPISGVQEKTGVVSDRWQKVQNKPTFTWNPSSDALSGLGGYQLYFGPDANGTAIHVDVAASSLLEWMPTLAGVATGTYYLRGRTWDRASNTSSWQTIFILKYDGTPPPNPGEATHADGPKNDTWQKITARPNFTWAPPTDEGSGMKGYLAYWGTDENGESSNFITASSLQSNTPLCAQSQACTGYLRLRSQDNVDLQAEKWSTTFVLRYDGAPPVADFTVNGGVTQTNQTLIQLNLQATDLGSGLREMRLSGDGQNWTPWEVYAAERVWEIPGISRQSWPIYLQVKDTVDWESAVVSRTVYFDVNVDQPCSELYCLWDYAMVTGAGAHTSQPTGYQGHSTLGQVMDSPRITSTNYLLVGGYEAGSGAIPLVVPGHDEFEFVNAIFASGVVNTTMQSGQYQMVGVWGEPALPNNRTEIASGNYRHRPGFLAARPSPKETPVPTATPTPGPTPTPTPTPDCDFPRVSINNGAVFTTDTGVTLNLCAPNATQMIVSDDGGFGGATWESYARSKAWTLTSYGGSVLPRYVYAAFKDASGQIYATYIDDIIFDPTPPDAKVRVGSSLPLDETFLAAARSGRENVPIFQAQGVPYVWAVDGQPLAEPIPLLAASADGTVDLYLSARDNVGNVTSMQVSDDGSFNGAWESYSALKQYTPGGGDGVKTVYARFQDEAGNASQAYTATFALDTLPPVGGIALSHPILGPDVVTTTVWLGAEDNLSVVAAMRLSTDPTFADAVWRPFASTLLWVYAQADRSRSALRVQFRDGAGNESEVYDAPLLVDSTPPLVYVEVEAGDTLTRTLRIYSYDELTYPDRMRLTNDPLFLEGVVTQPYADTVTWSFDERRVVWVQVQDGVGNWSEPYPAYAGQTYFDIPGDCNNDGKTDAGDISALALEIFDQDGNAPDGVTNGTFAGNPLGCDANRDATVDAGDISCAVLLIFEGPGACSVQANALNNLSVIGADNPRLSILLHIPATAGQPVTIPVHYAGNGHSISSLVFSLDYDQGLLTFDPADNNNDGIPDSVIVEVPPSFQASVVYDGSDTDGELDVLIADVFPPLAALPDGTVISVTLTVTTTAAAPSESPLPFAQEPRPSFGAANGSSVPGSVQDGSVLVGALEETAYPVYLPVIQH